MNNNNTDKPRYRELLEKVFQMEHYETLLYLREADLFVKKIIGGDKLGDVFKEFSSMELKHADRIAVKLLELGASPVWEFKPLENESSLHAVLSRHLKNEAASYEAYDELVALTDDADFKLCLKGIRAEEKEHLEKISHILRKLEK